MNDFLKKENNQNDYLGSLSPREVHYNVLNNSAIIVDIRADYETNYRILDFSNVIYLPYESYKDNYSIVPKDSAIIIVDNVGLKSPEVAKFLISKGYSNVAYVAGGIIEWDHADLPLKKDVEYELNANCACGIRPKKKV